MAGPGQVTVETLRAGLKKTESPLPSSRSRAFHHGIEDEDEHEHEHWFFKHALRCRYRTFVETSRATPPELVRRR
jgi:hypothetical protein